MDKAAKVFTTVLLVALGIMVAIGIGPFMEGYRQYQHDRAEVAKFCAEYPDICKFD